MSTWGVDPDRVVGILAGVDVEGETLCRAFRDMDTLSSESTSGLAPDGRTSVESAWKDFLSERHRVPGILLRALSRAAGSLTKATDAVVTGDEQMATTMRSTEVNAFERWGIDSADAYQAPGQR